MKMESEELNLEIYLIIINFLFFSFILITFYFMKIILILFMMNISSFIFPLHH